MTCIVGITDGQTVWIGADSFGSNGHSAMEIREPKVFVRGGVAIGFTSSFRMGQLLKHSLKIPTKDEGEDLMHYMVTKFVDAVRLCLSQGGCLRKENEMEGAGTFLVGIEGRLFRFEDDMQVLEPTRPYDACGSGESYALGALHLLHQSGEASGKGIRPRGGIVVAIEAAAEFSTSVGGEVDMVEVAGTLPATPKCKPQTWGDKLKGLFINGSRD